MDDSKNSFRLSCGLYEYIELWSMRRQKVKVTYKDTYSKEREYVGIITNVYSRNGLESVVFDEDLIIPTRAILRINDVIFEI